MTHPPQGPLQPGDEARWAPTAAGQPHPAHATGAAPAAVQPPPIPAKPEESVLRRFVKDPLSVVLILVIVAALAIAGVVGAELYGRNRANSVVANIVSCVVADRAKVSFGLMPPFIVQHLNGRYSNISIETAGNQIREAKGMKLAIDIKDVRVAKTADSAGTIGSLVADVTWSAEGIKQTLQDLIPLFGGIVSDVQTNASAGTIELDGPLGNVTAMPRVTDGGLDLQVLKVTGLGITLPRESVQPALDVFMSQLTENYPLGVKADDVRVTEDGVVSRFSTQNANMPLDSDACFSGL